MPSELIDQLATPGRMFIPVGEYEQDVWVVDKNEKGEVSKQRLFGVRVSAYQTSYSGSRNAKTIDSLLWLQYVPLTDKHKQVYS